jgi:sulfate/thiosulfate transport system substrate-binding protein
MANIGLISAGIAGAADAKRTFPIFSIHMLDKFATVRRTLTTKSIKKGQKEKMANDGKRGRRLALQLGIAGIALAATLGIAACGDDESGASGEGGGSIDLVAYSTPQQVYEDSLIPAFTDSPDGEGADFSTSFGSSGDQSRAVEAGQPADVVGFSLEPDMTRLVDAGLVAPDWNKNQYGGNVTDSVAVLMTRPDNPKDISSFDDLARDDVDVINPNPATSGGARWNIMAIYGSQIAQGKSDAEAQDFVKQVIANTSVQDDSARDSLNTFRQGQGDVLVGYENEALQAQEEGVELDYTIPDSTILIENPIAATKDAAPEAQKFIDYLYTPDAQQLFADAGYRPVVQPVFDQNKDKFPDPSGLFTIDKFGGWDKVADPFFGDDGWVIQVEADLGNPTE